MMKSIKGQIVFFTVFLVLLTICSSWYLSSKAFQNSLINQAFEEQSLTLENIEKSIAMLNRSEVIRFLTQNNFANLDRISLYDLTGKIIWDSKPEEAKIEYLSGSADFQRALKEPLVFDSIYNKAKRTYLTHMLKRISLSDEELIVVLSRSLNLLTSAKKGLNLYFFLLMLSLSFFAVLLSHFIIRKILTPLEELSGVASKLAEGKEARFSLIGPPEISNLARTLREMAEKLQNTLKLLNQQRNNLKHLIDYLPAGVILIDSEGKILYLNKSTIDMLDMAQGDYINKLFIGVIGLPKLIELYDELKERSEVESTIEVTNHNKRFLNCKAKRLEKGYLFLITDTTDQKQMEIARRNFIADASHEFQTPLTVIKAATEILACNPNMETSEREKLLQKIAEQQDRLSRLVDDLLYLSKLESQQMTITKGERETVDIVSILKDLASEYKGYPQARYIKWKVDIPFSRAPIEASYDAIKKALGNIIDNAVKYTQQKFKDQKGGLICISLDENKNFWHVSISDNGVGVPSNMTEDIFARFKRGYFKTGYREKSAGYGLGLAIAKNIIEGHGGIIELKSPINPTTFLVSLPKLRKKD